MLEALRFKSTPLKRRRLTGRSKRSVTSIFKELMASGKLAVVESGASILSFSIFGDDEFIICSSQKAKIQEATALSPLSEDFKRSPLPRFELMVVEDERGLEKLMKKKQKKQMNENQSYYKVGC